MANETTREIERAVVRYGTGELYGHDFAYLSPEDIRELSNAKNKSQPCPFRPNNPPCNKSGGVCTLKQYVRTGNDVAPLNESSLVATCPARFYDSNVALSWVGETLLGTAEPLILTELPFLLSPTKDNGLAAVGKIDMVLLHPDTSTLRWCALEIQSVYFSGASMNLDFELMKSWEGPGIPFPQGIRRPDFRSSGPKRLMPQLQIKVPTISRWGKKMAVVIDEPFWNSLGEITEVNDISNCDIAWFVMRYQKDGSRFRLARGSLHLTTLDRAVEGLTGGKPTSLSDFENTLRAKLMQSSPR